MRHIILLVAIATLFSCGQNDTKQKEFEMKQNDTIVTQKKMESNKNDFSQQITDDYRRNRFLWQDGP